MTWKNLLWGVLAGIAIELFFRLVKYTDASSTNGPIPKYRSYDNYVTVFEYISGGSRRWLNYALFRFLPPTIIMILMAALLSRYNPNINHTFAIFVAGFTSVALRDGQNLFKKVSLREKLMHISNIGMVAVASCGVALLNSRVKLQSLAPSVAGAIDNLWSSLLVALLIILYLEVTNTSHKTDDVYRKKTQISNYVLNSYNKIKDRYEFVISDSAAQNNCSKALLYAILINENMNRPRFIRVLENTFVKLTKRPLTVGLAQVSSVVPLSDTESIKIAAASLANSAQKTDSELHEALKNYNEDYRYKESIEAILAELKIYAPLLFARG